MKVITMLATGLSVAQAEELLSLPKGVGYKRIKQGRLRAFFDSQGLLKVSEVEIYRYLREEH